MQKKNNTVRYTAKEIEAKLAAGEDRTDWRKANSLTGRKLEASIREDVDDIVGELDWTKAVKGIPAPSDNIKIRSEQDLETVPVLNEE